jgi:hypothetical protein
MLESKISNFRRLDPRRRAPTRLFCTNWARPSRFGERCRLFRSIQIASDRLHRHSPQPQAISHQFCGVEKTVLHSSGEIMKTNRLLVAMTFTGMMLMGTSLYAQQDVDPSWYNPWDGPAAKSQPAPIAAKASPTTVASMAPKLEPQKPGMPASHKARSRSAASSAPAVTPSQDVTADTRRRRATPAGETVSGS